MDVLAALVLALAAVGAVGGIEALIRLARWAQRLIPQLKSALRDQGPTLVKTLRVGQGILFLAGALMGIIGGCLAIADLVGGREGGGTSAEHRLTSTPTVAPLAAATDTATPGPTATVTPQPAATALGPTPPPGGEEPTEVPPPTATPTPTASPGWPLILADFSSESPPQYNPFPGPDVVGLRLIEDPQTCLDARCLRVAYDVPPAGEEPYGLSIDLPETDLLDRSASLCLEVKAGAGQETFEIDIKDTNAVDGTGCEVCVQSKEYGPITANSWSTLEVPLGELVSANCRWPVSCSFNLHSVGAIALHFHDWHDPGTIYLRRIFVSESF